MTLTKEQQEEQTRILERGTGWDAYGFARNIPGADIEALQQVVLECKDGYFVYRFAKDIPGADIQVLHQRLQALADESPEARFYLSRFEDELSDRLR